jgi:outer membrane protein
VYIFIITPDEHGLTGKSTTDESEDGRRLMTTSRRTIVLSMFVILNSLCTGILPALDLSIDDALAIAERNFEGIRIQYNEVSKAAAQLREAEGRRLPEISADASFSYMLNPPTVKVTVTKGEFGSFMGNPFPPVDKTITQTNENTYFSVGASLSQPIYTWGKIDNSIKLAEAQVDASRANLNRTKRSVRRDLSKVYVSALVARASAELLEKTCEVLEISLGDREKSYNQGVINLQKVLEAKSNLAAMRTKLTEAKESYKNGIEGLSFYTGLDAKEISLASGFRTKLPTIDEEQVKLQAVAGSPDMELLRSQVSQAKASLGVEQGSALFLPDFTFVTSFGVNGQNIPWSGDNWTDTWDWDLVFTIGTKVRLFDGFKSTNRQQAAEKSLEAAGTGLLRLEKGLPLQVREAVGKINTTYDALAEKKAKLDEMTEAQKNAKASFDNQVITREEELGARALLYSAEMEYNLALFNFDSALSELEYLSGMRF